MAVKLEAKEITLAKTSSIVPWDKNANKHSQEQIDLMCKLIAHNGFRDPVIVSLRSDTLICGHLRLICAKKLKIKEIPVIYQEFESEEEEYQFMVAHNAINSHSELDLVAINREFINFGPDFDIDLFALKDFTIDPADKQEEPKKPHEVECPNCNEVFDPKKYKKKNYD